jgi:hypothetical protein
MAYVRAGEAGRSLSLTLLAAAACDCRSLQRKRSSAKLVIFEPDVTVPRSPASSTVDPRIS